MNYDFMYTVYIVIGKEHSDDKHQLILQYNQNHSHYVIITVLSEVKMRLSLSSLTVLLLLILSVDGASNNV